MTPETLNRILDPFFTTRRNEGGTGLGLSVSNTIMQDHGGTLQFDTGVGEGTTVKMLIPIPKYDQTEPDVRPETLEAYEVES
jgi:polar amino acid transport system substrate-binding protein